MNDATDGGIESNDAAQRHQSGREPVIRVGLANLTLTGEEHPLDFARTAADEYFALTIASVDDPSDVSVYRMRGTVSVSTQRGGRISIDRLDLTGELLAGRDRGEPRLTNAEPLAGRLREASDVPEGEDVRYTGHFHAEGVLSYTDGLNNAENLHGKDAVDLRGMTISGRIVDADHVLLTVTGNAALLNRPNGELAPAAVTM